MTRPAPWPRLGVHKLMDEQGWMVRSKFRPSMFWHVSWDMEDRKMVLRCDCPAGERLGEQDTDTPKPCRHVRLVTEAEAADGVPARPAATVNPATFVE